MLPHPGGFPDCGRRASHELSGWLALREDSDRRPCVLESRERISIATPQEPGSESGKALHAPANSARSSLPDRRIAPIAEPKQGRRSAGNSPPARQSRGKPPRKCEVQSRLDELLPQDRDKSATAQFFRRYHKFFTLNSIQQLRLQPCAPLFLILADQVSDKLARRAVVARGNSAFHVSLQRIGQRNVQGSHGHTFIL